MKKLVEKLLSWCKKSMKMRRCVGKSTAPVTGQSVGQTGNAEGVLPSTATETVDEIVLPAAVETAGMAETIDEKATFGKSGRKKPENMLEALQCFLTARYNFRYNLLTEQTEYRGKEMPDEEYGIVAQRDLNTFCLEARSGGINCWDKDVSRLLHSRKVENYHPFLHYMSHLPQWDGVDRVTPLAVRISRKPMWVKGFHRWMLGVAAQWLGQAQDCANAVAPMLVSREQGKRKSSFCKILMPKELTPYYIDKFDLTSESGCEQKLSLFGLINMDEFDKCREKGITVSCDLNYRGKLWSRERAGEVMGRLVPYVDVLIANEEDAKDVFGIEAADTDIMGGKLNHEGYVSVARQLTERFGCKAVAITLRGSISASENNWAGWE